MENNSENKDDFEKDPDELSWKEIEEFSKVYKARFDKVLIEMKKWYDSKVHVSL